MAQPGEARATPANARVGTVQKWIVGVAIACAAIGFIAFFLAELQLHAWRQPAPRPASLSMLYGIEGLFIALACLTYSAGQGVLMYLRPRDVQGQLRTAAERTRHPRLYGVAMIWGGITLVSAGSLLELQAFQTSLLDNPALSDTIYGLGLASILPLLLLEAYGWWRRSRTRETPE